VKALAEKQVDSEALVTNRICAFCKQQLNSSYPSALYHSVCARTIKAHYQREVSAVKKSLSRTLSVIDSLGENNGLS